MKCQCYIESPVGLIEISGDDEFVHSVLFVEKVSVVWLYDWHTIDELPVLAPMNKIFIESVGMAKLWKTSTELNAEVRVLMDLTSVNATGSRNP